MPIRWDASIEAQRRSERQLAEVIRALTGSRRQSGLSQAAVASALGVSRSLVSAIELGRIEPSTTLLAAWGAAVGLDVSIRAFPGGAPLRDAGQLRVLERLRLLVGGGWTWRTEVPVSRDPRDRRAIDAVLTAEGNRVAVEAVSRLLDAQAQVRPILLKQEACGIAAFVLALANSRTNRAAVAAGGATIAPAFPCSPRVALAALRDGRAPPANALIFA